jgi:hypothetical protein
MSFISDLFTGGAGMLVEKVGKAIDQVITSDEERLTLENEMYKAESEYKTEMRALDIKETGLYLKDVSSARKEQSRIQESENGSWLSKNIQPFLAIMVVGVTFIIFTMVLTGYFDSDSKESTITMMILGSLVTIVTQIISYFFGASRDVEGKNMLSLKSLIREK